MKSHEHLIIRKPRSQPRAQRLAWRVVTLGFWALYFYLLLPLITLLLWWAGVRTAYTELYPYNTDHFLLYMLPLIGLLCLALVILWSEYNRLRRQGRERRMRQRNTSLPSIAAALHASRELAEDLAGRRVVVLHMDDGARPIGMSERLLPIAAEPGSRVADLALAAHHEALHGQRL